MDIDASRLRADIEATAEFGAVETPGDTHGRTVLTGTESDRQARDYLVSRLEDAGIAVTVDQVGTIVGRWVPEGVDPDTQPVVAGSHLDSVPEGGIFDGPLGVYAALEAVRAIKESDHQPDTPLGVVSFTEEEGTRFPPLTGSSVVSGVQTAETALAARDSDGTTLAEALDSIGYRGDATIEAGDWDAWLEVHVEQGPRLESAGVPVGVVSDITGISQVDVTIEGETNHAGTTAMDDRADSLVAAAEVIQEVEDLARAEAERTGTAVGTVGSVDVSPNATNVIPGRTELGVDIRDVERDSMDAVQEGLREAVDRVAAERGLSGSYETRIDVDPTPMADRAIEAIHAGAGAAGIEAMDLHSGAGHDTMHVATATDAGMLFAPSVDGISHSPSEWTDWVDCATVTEVLAESMLELAGREVRGAA